MQPFKFQPAHTLNPAVPESLSHIIESCLAIDAEKRPAGIHEVAVNLLAVREDLRQRPPIPVGAAVAINNAPAGAESKASSGSSGPRIISAKLAEAEAQRRREEARHKPSGQIGAPNRGMQLLVALLCIALLLGGTALALMWHKAPHKRPVSSTSTVPPPGNPVPIPPSGNPPPNTPQNNMADSDETAPPTDSSPATFNLPITQELVSDGQGGQTLRLHITGDIHGQPNLPGTLAVFFYDNDGNRILARDPNSPYAHKNGQLVGSHSLETHSEDDSPFDVTVTIPLNAFPVALPSSIKFRCRIFLNHQSIGATDLIDLQPVTVNPPNESNPGTAAPPETGVGISGGLGEGNSAIGTRLGGPGR